MKSPFYKSKQKIEQDYARNAIADYESGDKKAAKYEKTEELEVAAGEGPKMMGKGGDKSPLMKKGSFMSKHCSSSPVKMENVLVRDMKSSGKNQYNKYGK